MKHIQIPLLTIIAMFIATSYSFSQNTCHDQLLPILEKKDYENALAVCDSCLQLYPNDHNLYKTKSSILNKLERDYDALVCLNEGVKRHPNNPDFLMLRANHYYYTGYFDLAIADNETALKQVDSTKVKILSNLASTKLHQRDFEGAISAFEKALAIHPEDPSLLNNIAAAYNSTGKKEAAITSYQKALSIDPLFPAALTSLGFLYAENGEYTEALKYIDKATEIEPKEPLNYNNRGYIKLKMGQLEEAEKDINYSLSLYPQNSYAYRNKALIFIEKNDKNQACEMLTQAINYGFTVMYGDEVEKLMTEHCK